MYLLSSGKTTSSIQEYVADAIRLNLSIQKRLIPGFKGGTEIVFTEITEEGLINQIKENITDIINRIRNQYRLLKLSLDSVRINGPVINIELNINDIRTTYEIAAGNI